MALIISSNTNESHLKSHVHRFVQIFFCKNLEVTGIKSIKRHTQLSCGSSTFDYCIQIYTEEKARKITEVVKTVLRTRVSWTKILNNKPNAFKNILEDDKAKMKTQRILGQNWDPKKDKRMFAIPKPLHTGQQLNERMVL